MPPCPVPPATLASPARPSPVQSWVAVKELILSYNIGDPIIYDIYSLRYLNLSSLTATQKVPPGDLSLKAPDGQGGLFAMTARRSCLERDVGGCQNYGPFLGSLL